MIIVILTNYFSYHCYEMYVACGNMLLLRSVLSDIHIATLDFLCLVFVFHVYCIHLL